MPSPRYADAEVYASYERLGSGVLVGRDLGLSNSHVSKIIRRYRREVLGLDASPPRLSLVPREPTDAPHPEVARLSARLDELERRLTVVARALKAMAS